MIKRNTIEACVAIILVVMAISALFYFPQPKGKVYACSLAEISPDYPLQVREECRKLNSVKIK